MQQQPVELIQILKINDGSIAACTDQVAVEEPLEIQLEYSTSAGRMKKNIAVTMRTPGNDAELAAGFLFTEGVIDRYDAIKEIRSDLSDQNKVLVILNENILPVLHHAERNFYSTSSCGVCGKASIDSVKLTSSFPGEKDNISIKPGVFYRLQDELRKQQQVFEKTGGIHASALFTPEGRFIMLREDVGRHNALDKVIGAAFLNNELPLKNCILLLSGRASFELLQKAAMAGIPIVCAVGAPSSLAIDMAKESGITLVGFLRSSHFNIYSGEKRIIL